MTDYMNLWEKTIEDINERFFEWAGDHNVSLSELNLENTIPLEVGNRTSNYLLGMAYRKGSPADGHEAAYVADLQKNLQEVVKSDDSAVSFGDLPKNIHDRLIEVATEALRENLNEVLEQRRMEATNDLAGLSY